MRGSVIPATGTRCCHSFGSHDKHAGALPLTEPPESPSPLPVQDALTSLGWSEYQDRLSPADRPLASETIARVVGQHRRQWDVGGASGVERAVLAGRRYRPDEAQKVTDVQPVVGDWVVIRRPAQSGRDELPVIDHVLPRFGVLSRGAAGRHGQGQVVATNVDWIAVVAACSAPNVPDHVRERALNPRRIERYLMAIEAGGARPMVVINKLDVTTDGPLVLERLQARLGRVPVVLASAKTGAGIEELATWAHPRQTLGFVGLSGVGKSSLVNRLVGDDRQKTQTERGSDSRGRHTTTHRELFISPSGVLIIDTPGMREFSLDSSTDEEHLMAFDDIALVAQSCRFRDCSHQDEPECAVRGAVVGGELDPDRLRSYQNLRTEIQSRERAEREGRAPRRGRPN